MIVLKILKNTIQRRNSKHVYNVFDDLMAYIADILTNKQLTPIVTELFIRCRKLNISLVFITHLYFAVPKILE